MLLKNFLGLPYLTTQCLRLRNQSSSATTTAIQVSSLRQLLRTDFILASSNSAEVTHFSTNFFNRSSDSHDILHLSEIARRCSALDVGILSKLEGLNPPASSVTSQPKVTLEVTAHAIQVVYFDVAKFPAKLPTGLPSQCEAHTKKGANPSQ